GQRQTIGRTVISTVPTVLQRQGIFTEAIGGRVPQIFDPATGASNRTPFASNTIPAGRMDPTAVALLQRYPAPTSAGTIDSAAETRRSRVSRTSATDSYRSRRCRKAAG